MKFLLSRRKKVPNNAIKSIAKYNLKHKTGSGETL